MIIELTHKGQVIARFGTDHQSRPAPAPFVPRWNTTAKEDARARDERVGK